MTSQDLIFYIFYTRKRMSIIIPGMMVAIHLHRSKIAARKWDCAVSLSKCAHILRKRKMYT